MAQIRAAAFILIRRVMKILFNVGVILLGLFLMFIVMSGVKAITCIGEKSGTMVVVGGTSTRCN